MKKVITIAAIILMSIVANAQQMFEDGIYYNPYEHYTKKNKTVIFSRHFWHEISNILEIENDMFLELMGETPKYHTIQEYSESVKNCKHCKKIYLAAMSDARKAADKAKVEKEEYLKKETEKEMLAEAERKAERELEEKIKNTAEKIEATEKQRLTFWKSKSAEWEKIIKESEIAVKESEKRVSNLEKQRFNELDVLERQYAGRLEGEIFTTKKSVMDAKYVELMKIETEKIKAQRNKIENFLWELKQEFNESIKSSGVEFTGIINEFKKIVITRNTPTYLRNFIVDPNTFTGFNVTNYREIR